MDCSLPSSELVSKDSGSKPCIPCGCIDEFDAKDINTHDIDISGAASLENEDGACVVEDSTYMAEEAFIPGGSGNVQYLDGKSYSAVGTSELTANIEAEAINLAADFSSSLSLDEKKSLKKNATFPCSTEASEDRLRCMGVRVLLGTNMQDHQSNICPNSSYERSTSLPGTWKVISAMKGGRAKNGMPSTEKFHVKWAPDVYDPPVTSVSHTLPKTYQQRPKSKRKEKNKQKQQKGRSSRGNGANKKNRGGIIQNSPPKDTSTLKDVDPVGGMLGLDTFGNQKKVLNYGMSNKEAKCGSSFLQEAAGRMHFSIGEAS